MTDQERAIREKIAQEIAETLGLNGPYALCVELIKAGKVAFKRGGKK